MNLFLCLLNDNFKGVYITINYINGVWIFQILKCLDLLHMCTYIVSNWTFQTCWKWSQCINIVQNHFCILGFKMSIVVLIEQSYKVCSKTVLIQTFIPTGLKWYFPHIQMEMNHMCQSHTTLHSLTFDFDFCLTFSWNFFCVAYEHVFMSLVSLIDIWSILWHKVYV